MKKNRRQELQTNILADRLGSVIQVLRPYVVPASIVLAVLVVSLGGISWIRGSQNRRDTEFWQEFLDITIEKEQAKSGLLRSAPQAGDYSNLASDLDALAEEYSSHRHVNWVHAAAGDARLAAGMRQLYSEKVEAANLLSLAKQSYGDLIELNEITDKDLDERVRYGYAQACEGLANASPDSGVHLENMKEAREYYTELSKAGVSQGIRMMAESRLRILKPVSGDAWSESEEDIVATSFASWLSQQELPDPPEQPPAGAGQNPAGLPPFNPGAVPGGGPVLGNPEAPAEEPAKEPAEKPTEEPAKEPAEKTTEESAKEPADKPTKDPAKEPAEKPIKEPAEAGKPATP